MDATRSSAACSRGIASDAVGGGGGTVQEHAGGSSRGLLCRCRGGGGTVLEGAGAIVREGRRPLALCGKEGGGHRVGV
jgi:hypothetical protein